MKIKYYQILHFILVQVIVLIISSTDLVGQIQQQWVKEYNGPGINKSDIATAICTDANGNIYVTGEMAGSGDEYDCATIKYNNQGAIKWILKYYDSIDFQSTATAITVDNSGNVYVTGYSGNGQGHSNNFLTIKYDSSGTQQWLVKYIGPESNDYAIALAVDNSGNVYVTGESYDIPGGNLYDIATVKYNSNGVQQWAERWNGPGNNTDEPTSLAIDNSGNVYVTGYTIDGNVISYATISYNSSGTQRWASIYNPSDNYTSIANAIAIDHQGFVYVSGRSHGYTDPYYKIATIKYNPSTGDTVWVRRYSSSPISSNWGYGIAVDSFNNIYASGAVGDPNTQTWGVADIKYNSTGVQLWASVYTDPARQVDYGEKIVVDSYGNSYIQGYSAITVFDPEDYLTAKFDSNGVLLWINYYNGPGQDRDVSYGIAIDNNGNAFITGFSYAGHTDGSTDYATVKYNSTGVQQWVERYNNSVNGDDILSDMKSDKSGNIYMAGTSYQQSSGQDIFLIKYNSIGDSLWAQSWDGPSDNLDFATGMNIDSSGNVYIVGATWDPDAEHTRWVTLKYDSSGNLLWSSLYPGSGGGGILNVAHSVAIDQSGNVYVFGLEATYNAVSGHYLLIKYNSSGNVVWTDAGSSNNHGNNAVKVFVDKDNYIYITCQNSFNINTLKYNPSGNILWTSIYDGSGNWDTPGDLFIDDSGNVYITGISMQNSAFGSQDYVTIKYNSSGTQLWVKLYNGTGSGYDGANAITVDTSGNVLVTGISSGSGSTYDYATIKYSPSGSELWVNRYAGSGNVLNFGTSVKTDQNGYVYVAGGTGTSTSLNFGLLALSPDAAQQWSAEYNALDDSLYTRPLISLGEDGVIYIAGSTYESGTDYRFALIKYAVTVPVELTSFTAVSNDNDVLLDWQTATETNNKGFEIQRSEVRSQRSGDQRSEWKTAGFVEGNGTSTQMHSYSFRDNNVSSGKYNYRLKQIDFDGSFEYSNIIEVEILSPAVFALSQNFPDPFNPATTINYSLSNNGLVTLKVYDILGKEVTTLVNENQKAGPHSINFNAVNLPSGVYIYRLLSGKNTSSKKMILLK